VVALVQDKAAQVQDLRRRFRVRRLELFGSAARGAFDPATSDLDFLLELQSMSPEEHSESYFGLLEALEDLFGRDVDLVELAAVRNPFSLRRIDESRELLYAA
jgi:predicted nucleotidyltransferase